MQANVVDNYQVASSSLVDAFFAHKADLINEGNCALFVLPPLILAFIKYRPRPFMAQTSQSGLTLDRPLSNIGSKFVCNKHITLIIIIDEYLRLNDYI
jgi:hypothetical protein